MRHNHSAALTAFSTTFTPKLRAVAKRLTVFLALLATLFSTLVWLSNESQTHTLEEYTTANWILNIASLVIFALTLEVFLPIRSVAHDDWVYKVRPSARFTPNLKSIFYQVLISAAAGSIIGAGNGHTALFAAVAALVRLSPPSFQEDHHTPATFRG